MGETLIRNAVQVQFFEKLKQSVPATVSVANEVADLLGISTDGAYRRMRGESVLGVDELAALCRHFKLSPETIIQTEDTTAVFQFHRVIHDEAGFADYMSGILRDVQRIHQAETKRIIYAAGDLPIFLQFYSPEYASFKMFFWKKAVLGLESLENKHFEVAALDQSLGEVCKSIAQLYVQIPSTEIWHQDSIMSNLSLIEFSWQSGMFATKYDALRICQALEELLALIEKQAERGSKFTEEKRWAENEGNFTMYQSEFVLMSNQIFVTAGASKLMYLTHNTFNIMSTTNSQLYAESEDWLKGIIRKSTQISGTGEKQRRIFFRTCRERVHALASRIQAD